MALEYTEDSPFGGAPLTYHRIESITSTRRVSPLYRQAGWNVEVTVEIGSYVDENTAKEMIETPNGPVQKNSPFITVKKVMLPDLDSVTIADIYQRLNTVNLPSNLEEAKNKQWSIIKSYRSLALETGFTFMNKQIQSDRASRENIQGAVIGAQAALAASAQFSVVWTCADNSLLTLSAIEVVQMGLALLNHVQACYNKGVQKREAINLAETVEDVEAITWESVE